MLVNRTFWTIFEHYQQLQDQLAIKKESFFFSSSSSTISPSILQKPSLSLPPFSLSHKPWLYLSTSFNKISSNRSSSSSNLRISGIKSKIYIIIFQNPNFFPRISFQLINYAFSEIFTKLTVRFLRRSPISAARISRINLIIRHTSLPVISLSLLRLRFKLIEQLTLIFLVQFRCCYSSCGRVCTRSGSGTGRKRGFTMELRR